MTKDQLLVAARPAVHARRDPRLGVRRRPAAVLPAGGGLDRVPVHDGAPQGARRLDPQAHRPAPASRCSSPTTARSPSCCTGSGTQAVSTTMGFTRLLRSLARDEKFGQRVVPIIPDEARTFGMDSLFRELKIYASQGQKYEPVDHELLLSYAEATNGQILEEGITEAGSTASFIAAGTAYATRGVPMVPFYTFYSMFGFQRVGDLIWQAADARTRGFLLGATAGRTTLMGEGLQHQDGHSLVHASTVPPCQAYDPAFAYEVAAIVQEGLQRMYGGAAARTPTSSTTSPSTTRTTRCRRCPRATLPRFAPRSCAACTGGHRRRRARRAAPRCCSPARRRALRAHAASDLAEHFDVGVELWSATSYKRFARTRSRSSGGTGCIPSQHATHRRCRPAARRRPGPDRRRHRLHEDRARAGRPLPAGPHLRAARHRRHGPQRHPRGAAPLLRDRPRPRRGRRALRTARHGRRQRGSGRGCDQSLRHRRRRQSTRPISWSSEFSSTSR